jgi:hypothetical protein
VVSVVTYHIIPEITPHIHISCLRVRVCVCLCVCATYHLKIFPPYPCSASMLSLGLKTLCVWGGGGCPTSSTGNPCSLPCCLAGLRDNSMCVDWRCASHQENVPHIHARFHVVGGTKRSIIDCDVCIISKVPIHTPSAGLEESVAYAMHVHVEQMCH